MPPRQLTEEERRLFSGGRPVPSAPQEFKPEPLRPPAGIEGVTAPPPPLPALGTITPRPNQLGTILDEGTIHERRPYFLDKSHRVGQVLTIAEDAPSKEKAQEPGADVTRYKILDKTRSDDGGLWKYTLQRADIFQGWKPPEPEEYMDELGKFVQIWEHLIDPSQIQQGRMLQVVPELPMDFHGSPNDILDAHQSLFNITKTLESYRAHLDNELPETIEAYNETLGAASDEKQALAPTLQALPAVALALNQYAEAHPDDYTQRIGTDAGMDELWQIALKNFMSAPGPEVELNILRPAEFVVAVEEAFVPEVPFLKDSLQRATEIFLDPIFIATLAVLPPVGLVSKARLLTEIAIGGALGEEAAEQVGVPEPVGGLAGMILGPSVTRASSGFTRGVLKSGLEKARIKPVPGEPATELLVRRGEILELPELRQALADASGETLGESVEGGRRVFYRGVSSNQAAAAGEGALLTNTLEDAQRLARSNAKTHGGEEVIQIVTVEEGAATAVSAEEGLAGIRGAVRVTNPKGIKELKPGENPIPFLTGGGGEPTHLQFMEDLIRIHVERPEAQDNLRKLALNLSKRVPGMKRAVEIINRNALAESPALKGAIGWENMNQYDTALRRQVMAPLQGERVPFRQNSKAQVFVPFEGNIPPQRVRGAVEPGARGQFLNLPQREGLTVSEAGPLASKAKASVGGIQIELEGAADDIIDIIRISRVSGETAISSLREVQRFLVEVQRLNPGRILRASPETPRLTRIYERLGLQQIDPLDESLTPLLRLPEDVSSIRAVEPVASATAPTRTATGEWIAQGDVFESVMRGDKTYLGRLDEGQIAWIGKARATMEPFIRQLEMITGQNIGKLKGWWPRFVDDIPNKKWTVNAGKGKPPALFSRVVESQEEAISEYGIRYKPDLLKVMETAIAGFQRVSRDVTLHKYLKKNKIIEVGRKPTRKEVFASDIVPSLENVQPGVISIEHLNEIKTLIGPGTRNPVITIPQKVNSVARVLLTGVLDTGVGSLQLTSLFFLNPQKWGEAMGRSFFNMLVEPKQFYRFVAKNAEARNYVRYGGNIGLESEFFELANLGLPVSESIRPAVDVLTFPTRTLVNRMQTGFDSALAYGRIFAFDAMAGPARAPGPLLRAAGARPLEGQALHDEMFRLARFTDTLIGQPELRGIISRSQQQVESAYIWFATRYTRSLLGTASYVFGRGYTPAQARTILAKMLIGGMAVQSGMVAAIGAAQGKSQDEILKDIQTTLNPLSGKKYMSIKAGRDWYGMGGVYRAAFSALGTLADADNWRMETWRERILDNPLVRIWRSRTAPFTGTMMDFLEGEDFIGREINFWDMVDDPRLFTEYAKENFTPFSLNAVLQEGGWERKTARGTAEFFGLRSSPETAFESLSPVLDRVANEHFGMDFDALEHNTPAEDFVRNSPAAKAVEAGFALPLLRSAEEKKWEVYRGLRDDIRDKFAEQKEELDNSFFGGHISGKDFRDEYRSIQSNEFHELQGTREALQAGLDLEFEGEEAPAGTVDFALGEYFDIKVEDYMDKTTRQVDWDSFFSDRDAAISQIPEGFEQLVDDYINRHQGNIAKDFRKNFDQTIGPSRYFEMREVISEQLGLPLNDIENAIIGQFREKGQRAAPSEVGSAVETFLNAVLVDRFGENAPNIKQMKDRIRETNPRLDVELFRQGYVSTVRSLGAIQLSEELKREHPELGYFTPPLAKDVLKDLALRAGS